MSSWWCGDFMVVWGFHGGVVISRWCGDFIVVVNFDE